MKDTKHLKISCKTAELALIGYMQRMHGDEISDDQMKRNARKEARLMKRAGW